MNRLISDALRALAGEQSGPRRNPQSFTLEERPGRRRRQQSDEESVWGTSPEDARQERRDQLQADSEITRGSLTENEIERPAVSEEQQRRGIRRDAIPTRSVRTESLRRDLRNRSMVRRAILMSEILGQPRALRQYGRE